MIIKVINRKRKRGASEVDKHSRGQILVSMRCLAHNKCSGDLSCDVTVYPTSVMDVVAGKTRERNFKLEPSGIKYFREASPPLQLEQKNPFFYSCTTIQRGRETWGRAPRSICSSSRLAFGVGRLLKATCSEGHSFPLDPSSSSAGAMGRGGLG